MLILWQTGIFPAHNRAMELRSTDRPEVKTSKDPDKSVNPIDLRSEEASTPVLKDTPVVIQSPSKVELDALIEKWLQVDNTELPVDSNRLQPCTELVLVPNVWKCARTHLMPPSPAEEGDYFGYAMDSQAQVTVVGSPGVSNGAGAIYVYGTELKVLQTICAPTPGDRFGMACLLSPSAGLLFIQSASAVWVYLRNVPDDGTYKYSEKLDLSQEFQMLGCAPEGCLWLTNQNHCTTHIMERAIGGQWDPVVVVPLLTMQIVFDPQTQHVWTACSEGLHHWSKNLHGQWTENASWLQNLALTTLEKFTTLNGGNSYLVLGEAQFDRISLVSGLDPHTILDRVDVPGGHTADASVLFGDRVLWWNQAQLLLATVPLDAIHPVRNCGSVIVYQLSSDTRLMPVVMLRHSQLDLSAQFGSHIKLHDATTLLISAPGAAGGRGAVEVFSCK